MADLSLNERLAYSRKWLLTGGHMAPLELRAMGADPWTLEPPVAQRMSAAVVRALRELADHLEQQGVQVVAADSLLLDQPLHQQGQQLCRPLAGEVG